MTEATIICDTCGRDIPKQSVHIEIIFNNLRVGSFGQYNFVPFTDCRWLFCSSYCVGEFVKRILCSYSSGSPDGSH
jgi:hypothetical protein